MRFFKRAVVLTLIMSCLIMVKVATVSDAASLCEDGKHLLGHGYIRTTKTVIDQHRYLSEPDEYGNTSIVVCYVYQVEELYGIFCTCGEIEEIEETVTHTEHSRDDCPYME